MSRNGSYLPKLRPNITLLQADRLIWTQSCISLLGESVGRLQGEFTVFCWFSTWKLCFWSLKRYGNLNNLAHFTWKDNIVNQMLISSATKLTSQFGGLGVQIPLLKQYPIILPNPNISSITNSIKLRIYNLQSRF